MNILVGILAHQLSGDTLARVHRMQALDHSGHDVMVMWGQDQKPDETRFAAVTRKYEAMRRIFLSGHWDALLTIEQDMLVPDDTLIKLSRLLKEGADIAYGLYVWRYSNQHWWSAHPRVRWNGGTVNFWSLTHHPTEARRMFGQLLRVEGLGLGCTMISRDTMKRLPFRQTSDDHCCDTMLALDAVDTGLTQVMDLSVVCGHLVDRDHAIWPDPDTETLYTIKEIN